MRAESWTGPSIVWMGRFVDGTTVRAHPHAAGARRGGGSDGGKRGVKGREEREGQAAVEGREGRARGIRAISPRLANAPPSRGAR
jgi:hypothetical protein